MLFTLLLLLLFVIPVYGDSIDFEVHIDCAEEPSEVLIASYGEENTPFSQPVTVEETADYISMGNHLSFITEFYKGLTGYNKIYYRNASVLVCDERMVLECLQQRNWKQRGTPIDVSWVKITDTHYDVTRHYDDYLGTTYDVKYAVRTGEPVKIADIHKQNT